VGVHALHGPRNLGDKVVGGEIIILLRNYIGKQLQGISGIKGESNVELESMKTVYKVRID
jgi:hypothetical protein